jgi:hypothetical protein
MLLRFCYAEYAAVILKTEMPVVHRIHADIRMAVVAALAYSDGTQSMPCPKQVSVADLFQLKGC